MTDRLHEVIAYHQRMIDEYGREVELLEGKVKLSEDVMEAAHF